MKRQFIVAILALALAKSASSAITSAPQGHYTVPQQVFDGMKQNFAPDRARGVHTRYQFDLSGPNGGLWWIEVNDTHCRFGRGRIDHPGVTFLASDRDWVALSNGTLSGVWAFVTGRLKIHGDQKLARELDDLFNR